MQWVEVVEVVEVVLEVVAAGEEISCWRLRIER